MRFPGIAYQFVAATDTAGPTALIVSRHNQISTSANLLEHFFTDLPKDRILVLTNVSLKANPGTGNSAVQIKIQGFSQGVENFNIAQLEPDLGADKEAVLNWQGEVYIQGGGVGTNTLRFMTFYDLAVNANSQTLGFHGIVIPRGNMGGF